MTPEAAAARYILAKVLLAMLERTKLGEEFDSPELARAVCPEMVDDEGCLIWSSAAEGAKGVLRWLMREGT